MSAVKAHLERTFIQQPETAAQHYPIAHASLIAKTVMPRKR